MLKRRGKGKISNDLVAASCAAVLAVYAAGYLRTRDAARRFETLSKERRTSVRTQDAAAVTSNPLVKDSSGPTPQLPPEFKSLAATVAPVTETHKLSSSSAGPKRAHTKKPAAIMAKTEPVLAPTDQKPASVTPESDAVSATPQSPNAPREIAPVPLPVEETRGPMPIAIARDDTPVYTKWRDGTYTGVGSSNHGDIEARVVIKDGRIIEAGIATCDTRYPCSVIDRLIHQPVERQSPDVDYMSHATESSDAYYYGLVDALNSAREPASGDSTNNK